MNWNNAALRNVVATTESAEHHPLPVRPINPNDLFLPVERRHSHRPRLTWFWTGFLVASAIALLTGAIVCRALGG